MIGLIISILYYFNLIHNNWTAGPALHASAYFLFEWYMVFGLVQILYGFLIAPSSLQKTALKRAAYLIAAGIFLAGSSAAEPSPIIIVNFISGTAVIVFTMLA